MTEHDVVIAGGGPTGMMLAAELALAGADVVIVERRADQSVESSRAGGLHIRTIEVLDQRGVAERFLAAGTPVPAAGFGGMILDVSDLPSRHNHVLALWQRDFEPILAGWVAELGAPTLREREVVGFAQDGDGVDVDISDGTQLRAQYLVGCDGGRSVVRKVAGIDFAGWDASTSWIIGEVDFDGEPQVGARPEGGGLGPVDPSTAGGPHRVVLLERPPVAERHPSIDDLRSAIVAAYGDDFGLRHAHWVSRFDDTSRQAAAYRSGRVLLAGDAAHVHAPTGGQGLNTGVQDAVNLGWKLAQVVRGGSPDDLLDTYHDERHPVAARVLHNTMAQVALSGAGERPQALRDTMAELLAMDEPRRHVAAMISGLDIRYGGDGDDADLDLHPLVGRRMPDLDLDADDGPTTVFALLHEARPVLLDMTGDGSSDLAPGGGRVRLVGARSIGPCEVPLVGEVELPPAVLVRPDGHVAWVGALTDPELATSIDRWFGTGTGASAAP